MKRLLGILFALVAIVGGVLWGRSYFVADVFVSKAGKGADGLWTLNGGLLYQRYWFPRLGVRDAEWHYRMVPRAEAQAFGGSNPFFDPLRMPLWFVTIGSAAMGAGLLFCAGVSCRSVAAPRAVMTAGRRRIGVRSVASG